MLALAFLLILALAAAFRLPALGLRPFHGDEANQAVRTGMLLEDGVYEYDPHEHHGPTLYYLALIPLRLTGTDTLEDATEATLRLLPAVFGIALIALLWPLRHALGPGATLTAALFTALSPALTFYSRYYIQEPLFIFFAFAALVSGWRYCQRPTLTMAALTGACLGLTFATKETCVLIFLAMALAIAGTVGIACLRKNGDGTKRVPKRVDYPHFSAIRVAAFLLAGLIVSVVLFSSFFTHWQGVLDSIRAFTTYLTRAEGEGSAGIHDHPWHYYLSLLTYTYRAAGQRYTEALPLVLGGFGALYALLRPQRNAVDNGVHLERFLALYTLVLVVLYALIPYKTPWNLLPCYQPLLLLAGIGLAALVRGLRWRPLQGVALLLLTTAMAHLGWQAYRVNFVYPAHEGNPHVYAHTSTNALRMVERINNIAALNPNSAQMPIIIVQPDGDYWPLPWYLRHFDNAGYWEAPPATADAPILIADTAVHPALANQLQADYMIQTYGLRPGEHRLLYIRRDLWDRFMAERQ
ncbi:MAG: flippase activity-associated protein Agl23 [Candidatus Hydrogenedentota bacterium]